MAKRMDLCRKSGELFLKASKELQQGKTVRSMYEAAKHMAALRKIWDDVKMKHQLPHEGCMKLYVDKIDGYKEHLRLDIAAMREAERMSETHR